MLITIDGPTGSGKTSTAMKLAKRLGIFHLKGGIFLRSLTYFCIQNDIFQDDLISSSSEDLNLRLGAISESDYPIFLDDTEVSGLLWTREVNRRVSHIAGLSRVRKARKLWLRKFSQKNDLVADGRTLGTEIFPEATHKFYLTCDINERARRRLKQAVYGDSLDAVKRDILARDKEDRQGSVDRLVIPANAIRIDSTALTQEQVISEIITVVDG